MRPAPALLQKLTRSRLLVRQAVASRGVGERKSRAKGSGIEFADHREYQPGDDARHIDLHLHARLGTHFIRQYSVFQQLPVTIVVDGSESMAYGTPDKFGFATLLAGTLGFAALAGGDSVSVAVMSGGRLHWSPRLSGARRAEILFEWLEEQKPRGTAPFGQAIAETMPKLAAQGLLILISDWWSEDVEADLRSLRAGGHEVVGIQVVSPEEADPGRLGGGDLRLVDAETGHEVELALDRATLDRYAAAFAEWRGKVRQQLLRVGGRFVEARTDDDPERLILQDWRRAGLIS